MPALAGTSRMRYRRFLAFNAAGGLVWGVGFVLLGYVTGNWEERYEPAKEHSQPPRRRRNS